MPDFKVGRLVVISLWAEDTAAATHFYRDVLGLPLLPSDAAHKHLIHFQLEGAYLLILKGRPRAAENSEPERFPLFALHVDDLDMAVEQLKAHDVPLPWGVEGRAGNRYVMFHDPANNLIELAGP